MEIKNGKWYVAYAVHSWAGKEDICSGPFDTYEEAYKHAKEIRIGGDSSCVYFRDNDEWKWEERQERC